MHVSRKEIKRLQGLEQKRTQKNQIYWEIYVALRDDKGLPESVIDILDSLDSPVDFIDEWVGIVHYICCYQRLVTFAKVMKKYDGINVNKKDTCMHIASRVGNLDLVLMLLEYNARCDVKNAYDELPVEVASHAGVVEILKGFTPARGKKTEDSLMLSPIKSKKKEEVDEIDAEMKMKEIERNLERSIEKKYQEEIESYERSIKELGEENKKLSTSFRSLVKENKAQRNDIMTLNEEKMSIMGNLNQSQEVGETKNKILMKKLSEIKQEHNRSLGKIKVLREERFQDTVSREDRIQELMKKLEKSMLEKEEMRKLQFKNKELEIERQEKLRKEYEVALNQLREKHTNELLEREKRLQEVQFSLQNIGKKDLGERKDLLREFDQKNQKMKDEHDDQIRQLKRFHESKEENLRTEFAKERDDWERKKKMHRVKVNTLNMECQKLHEELAREKQLANDVKRDSDRMASERLKEEKRKRNEAKLKKMQFEELQRRATYLETNQGQVVNSLREKHEEAKEKLRAEVRSIRVEREKEVKRLQELHLNEKLALVKEYEGKIQNVTLEQENKILEQNQRWESLRAELNEKHDEQKREMLQDMEDERTEILEESRKQLQSIRDEEQQKLENVTADHLEKIEQLALQHNKDLSAQNDRAELERAKMAERHAVEIGKIEQNNEKLRAQISSLEASLAATEEKCQEIGNTMGERISILETNVERKKKKLQRITEEKISANSRLTFEINNLKDENNSLQREVDKTTRDMKDVSARCLVTTKTYTDQVTRLKKEKDVALHKVLTLEQEKEETKESHAKDMDCLKREMRSEIDLLRKEKADIKRETDSEVCEMETLIKQQKEKFNEILKVQRLEGKEELVESQEMIERLEAEIELQRTKFDLKAKSLLKRKDEMKSQKDELDISLGLEKSTARRLRAGVFLVFLGWAVTLVWFLVSRSG